MDQRDLRVIKSRRALMDAGMAVLMSNPGASLTQIAKTAGIGRATLYRHFESRQSLILALASEALSKTQAACSHINAFEFTGKQALEEIFRCVIPLGSRYHFLLSLWQYADQDDKLKKIYRDQITRLGRQIERARHEGSISPDIAPQWATALFDSCLYVAWQTIGEGSLTQSQATRHAISTFFHGVQGPARP